MTKIHLFIWGTHVGNKEQYSSPDFPVADLANLNKKLSVDERNNKAFIAILGKEHSKSFKLEECEGWYVISCLMLKNVGDLLDTRPGFMRFSFVIKKGFAPAFDPFSKLNEIADSYYEKSSDSVALTVKAHDFDSKIKIMLANLNDEARNMDTAPRTVGNDVGFIGIQDPKDAFAKFSGNGSGRLWSYETNYLVPSNIVSQIAKLPGFLPLDGPVRIQVTFRDINRLKQVRIDNRPQKLSDDGIYIFNEGDTLTYKYENREWITYDPSYGVKVISMPSKQKESAGAAKSKFKWVPIAISLFVLVLISGGVYYFIPFLKNPSPVETLPPSNPPDKPPVVETLDTTKSDSAKTGDASAPNVSVISPRDSIHTAQTVSEINTIRRTQQEKIKPAPGQNSQNSNDNINGF